MSSRRAVFLDRDGVINRALVRDGVSVPPATVDEIEVLPGVSEACVALRDAGYVVVVVTNQPDVARGTQRRETVEAINAALAERVRWDDLRVCYHDDEDHCACRKPAPGMLLAAAVDWQIDMSSSYIVGDRWKDIAAGQEAGCSTILVGGSGTEAARVTPNFCAPNLAKAATVILERAQSTAHRSQG